jgi:hypothetical protein
MGTYHCEEEGFKVGKGKNWSRVCRVKVSDRMENFPLAKGIRMSSVTKKESSGDNV